MKSCQSSSSFASCASVDCASPLFFSFVSDVINIYYADDEVVQEDEEIQGFVKDACSFGMQDFDQCGGLRRRDLMLNFMPRGLSNKLKQSDGVKAVAAAFLYCSHIVQNLSSAQRKRKKANKNQTFD